jgi:hypothetical protein
MSHEHRDEHQLADLDVVEPEPVVMPAPVQAVANTDAARRAEEKRKAEGVPEQTTQHQFTGDLPEPSRGGTDIETRIVFGDGAWTDDAALAKQPGTARRGPPPPRAQQHADEGSWAAPPLLDAVGPSTGHESRWTSPATDASARFGRGHDASWTRPT